MKHKYFRISATIYLFFAGGGNLSQALANEAEANKVLRGKHPNQSYNDFLSIKSRYWHFKYLNLICKLV